MTPRAEFLSNLCQALKTRSHTVLEDDDIVFELPLSYIDAHPIELHVDLQGRVSDGAQTFLRLQSQGRLESFLNWDIKEEFLRVHRMARNGADLVFTGNPANDIFAFIQGLHDLEVILPSTRDASPRFDHLIKRKVEDALDQHRAAARIDDDDIERILHPTYSFLAELPDHSSISLEIKPDFANRTNTDFYVILSRATDSSRARGSHVKEKLAEFYAARASASPSAFIPRVHAIIPKDSYIEPDELKLIHLFTGNPPFEVESADVRPLVNRLITNPGGPLHRYT